MTKNQRKVVFDSICKKYGNDIWIHTGPKRGVFYSRIISREVVIPEECYKEPDDWDLFALLHEIGHVLTNTDRMKRCEQEYFATKWALNVAKEMCIKVSKETIDIYQEYIWEWRERGLKLKGKEMPSIKELTLAC